MVIIDTSVAYKWFDKDEINSDLALELLNLHITGQDEISVPDLLLYELTNAWVTKGKLNTDQIKDNLAVFQEYGLNVVPINFDLIEKSIALAKACQETVYDSIYAILAQENECDLVSADQKFVKQLNLPYIKYLASGQ